jgi:uncharacterized protein (DUF2126 family)
MTKPQIQIGKEVREMTDDEFQQWTEDSLLHKKKEQVQAEIVEAEKAKKIVEAKLEALGLTADDLKALGL